MKKHIQQIFLEKLPQRIYRGRLVIDWIKCINYKVKFIYDDIEDYVKIIDYEKNNKNYLTIDYNGKEFDIHTGSFSKCCLGKLLMKYTNEFRYNINDFIDENKNLKIIDCEVRKRPNNTKRKDKYYLIECQDCKSVKWILEENIKNKHGINCNECSDGIKYPEKFMKEILNQLKIEYKFQYSPEWIKPRKYDFYISSLNIIIEMDGGLGHGKNNNLMNGITKKESKIIDDYKDELAELHGIKVIRIDCNYEGSNRFEYIKQNIFSNKILNKLFDLNVIDFKACDFFCW